MLPRFVSRTLLLFVFSLLFLLQAAHAGVFISVRFAPPPLPVYVQPPCPEPNLIWVPGYWAFDYDAEQYYWVPGAWVPAPFEGALWTPPYWGWDDDLYVFHPGYWGWDVGYYGGVNYGFGYMGVGFVGGEWHDHDFVYNTAVVSVNRTVIQNTYVNETIVHNTTIVNNHVSYEGGPGGIRHEPTLEERRAFAEQHVPPTRFQTQHIEQAKFDRGNFFNTNRGNPHTLALSRPLPQQRYTPPPIVSRPAGTTRQRDVQPQQMNQNPRISGGGRMQDRSRGMWAGGASDGKGSPRSFSGPSYGGPQQSGMRDHQNSGNPQLNSRQQQRPMAESRSSVEPRYSAPQQQRPVAEPRSFPAPRYSAPQQQRPMAQPRSFPEPHYNAPQQQRQMVQPRSFPEPRFSSPQQQRSMPEPRNQRHH